jgi:hypothetical protein
MKPTRLLAPLLVLLALPPATTGCILFGGGGAGGGDTSGGNTIDQDIAAYEAKKTELDQHRTMFKSSAASELAGVGTRLFWLEFPTFDPTLHSFDAPSSAQVNYGFSIGTGDTYNYRASEDLVVSAEPTGGSVILHAFAIGQKNQSAGDLTLDAPADGTRWWAYAPDHKDVYYVTTTSGTTLWKWTPPAAAPVMLFNLEDTGAQIGEFQDFGVDSGKMIFIEGGRIWSLDIAAKKSTWLGNKTEATSAFSDQDGVLFSTAAGPFFYSYQTKMPRDIAGAIAASKFELSSTFASAHLYDQDLARKGSVVGYIGQSGFFTFDMNTNEVSPILLNGRDNSVVYRYPVILDDGSAFVQGLESQSGATGADGPLYRVDINL